MTEPTITTKPTGPPLSPPALASPQSSRRRLLAAITTVRGRWDLPTLAVEATSRIEFYNAGSRRYMHKVRRTETEREGEKDRRGERVM